MNFIQAFQKNFARRGLELARIKRSLLTVFLVSLFGLFLIGCKADRSRTEIALDQFIYTEAGKDEQENGSKINRETEFFFAAENFPTACRWEALTRVVDGDTVIVGKDERVRFIGIDTPETKHPEKPFDPKGLLATKYLKELLIDAHKLCLIQDTLGDTIDKYDRTLAYLFTEEGVDINAEMIRSGWAKGYFYFPFDRKAEFRAYENQAKIKKIGLWE